MDQIRIPRSVSAHIEALGFSPADVLRQAGLPQTLFNQERIVITTAQWLALFRAIETLNDDPALGLKLLRIMEGGPYDPLLITALSAPSFRAALHMVARYKRLFSAEDLRVVEQDGVWSVMVAWLFTKEPTPPLLLDLTFACFVELGRRGVGRVLPPERVLFRRSPQHQAMYEAHFQCPVDFGAPHDMMVYSAEAMAQPFFTYNPELLALLEPQFEADLHERVAQQRFIDQVKMLLRSRIAGQPPTTHDVAQELNMSARTLQRRLADEGTQFHQLLETVRHEMAKQYLCESSLELGKIAFLLGYQEASSFHRAFQHWEGLSPGQWRARQR